MTASSPIPTLAHANNRNGDESTADGVIDLVASIISLREIPLGCCLEKKPLDFGRVQSASNFFTRSSMVIVVVEEEDAGSEPGGGGGGGGGGGAWRFILFGLCYGLCFVVPRPHKLCSVFIVDTYCKLLLLIPLLYIPILSPTSSSTRPICKQRWYARQLSRTN